MLRNDIKCDVLVIGGGIAGLANAVSVKERRPDLDVLVIEKNFAGYSGKANRGGGVLQYFDPEKVRSEDFLAFHVKEVGCWLGHQDLMLKYVRMNPYLLQKLMDWGVVIPREENGDMRIIPTGPMTAMICVDLDISLRVRRTAEKLGVRFMDKTAMAELLTSDGKVCGAVAYSLLNGDSFVISAPQVVLATGSQNYRIASMWSNGRGDGILAAYRAGAKLRNVEFGNFAQLVKVNSHNEIVFGENFMYNAEGEFITRNFRAHRESDINSNAIQEWFRQMSEGKGPVHLDFGDDRAKNRTQDRMWGRPYGRKFHILNDENANAVDNDLEVCPLFIGEQSPVYVDADMRCSLPGLYAIGDLSYSGSGIAGAVPAPPGRNRGSGILNAVFAAVVCAETVAGMPPRPAAAPKEAQVQEIMERLYAPLNRAEGVPAEEVIDLIQYAMGPVENSVVMNEERINKALELVEKAKALSAEMKANNLHELMSCHEAEAMVLSAELHYRASLIRKESRGWFLREDCPGEDNENWLKWIIAQNINGEMDFSTEDVPLERWPIKPEGVELKRVPVTEEEKASELYKYFTLPLTEADPAKYAAVALPFPQEKAHAIQDMNKLFDEGYLDMELGYCNLPDGTGVLANITQMPGVTPEMFDWWFAWHGVAPMRYKVWNPHQHYSCQTRNLEKALDKSLSMKERYWDTVHDVYEDVGNGPQPVIINFRNPVDVGFDPEKLKDFKGTIVCAGNEKSPTIMVHFIRPVEGGCELRSRFWIGYSAIGGKPVKTLPPRVKLPLAPVKALLTHNIKEFTHLAAILPRLYEEFHADFE